MNLGTFLHLKMVSTSYKVPRYSTFQEALQIMTHLGLALISVEGVHSPRKGLPYIYSG